MNLSIIWTMDENEQSNEVTLQNLKASFRGGEQVIICGTKQQRQAFSEEAFLEKITARIALAKEKAAAYELEMNLTGTAQLDTEVGNDAAELEGIESGDAERENESLEESVADNAELGNGEPDGGDSEGEEAVEVEIEEVKADEGNSEEGESEEGEASESEPEEMDSDNAIESEDEIIGNSSVKKAPVIPDEVTIEWVDVAAAKNEYEVIKIASEKVTSEYTTLVHSGDVLSSGWIKSVEQTIKHYPEEAIFMMKKIMPSKKVGAFSDLKTTAKSCRISLNEKFTIVPFYFGGTVIKSEFLVSNPLRPERGLEMERELMLRTCYKTMSLVFMPQIRYRSGEEKEGHITFYKGIYEPAWYDKSFSDFWIPFFKEIKASGEEIPYFLQYQAMFTVVNHIDSNLNNRNKHVIEEGHEEDCLRLIGELFQYIDDPVLYNAYDIKGCSLGDSVKWLFGVLKNGEGYKFEKGFLGKGLYYAGGEVFINKINTLSTNILNMDYRDGRLEVDGTIHPILFAMADEIYALFNNEKYALNYTGRYTMTKIYGVSVYKTHPFHISLPMDGIQGKKTGTIFFCAQIGNDTVKTKLAFESHFSRISNRFAKSYWCFGRDKEYMMTKVEAGLRIKHLDHPKKALKHQEKLLQKAMLRSHSKRDLKFLALRKAYFLLKPIMKRKPIWMYIDKIYKGGDSSEYLYRYAVAQNDNIQHYYLIDKNSTDYERLKKDGYKPLVRGSMKHRLVFLMADMMVISNSTVFAFNNYGLPNSSYIRDLVDFHVCCVQHGLSVQKIAVAQNRLRDNTRLYFCASEYEIENLSKPIYDYVGYDALKLTGVPRYDGLKNDDKKQIMISPTWRMQAAVPVRTNEGEQRDYNPMFKESTYFRVFNSLINDPRLINAAKKYGYRIKYVLHPIVSSQVKDFDKNDYVDIIPAVGDMSYEKMFCESSLMVTDFSGIQFDFAYMRKPLVYLHHKDIPQHYEEGTFFYDTMGFGEICRDNDELIDTLCEYMANGCKMKEEYVRRADDFFYYSDHNNCKRIYDTMIEYQRKLHGPKQEEGLNEEGN